MTDSIERESTDANEARIRAAVKEYIETELLSGQDPIAVGEEDDIFVTGMVDSVGAMRLVGFIEDRFSLQVPPEDVTLEHFSSIASIASYLQTRRAATRSRTPDARSDAP